MPIITLFTYFSHHGKALLDMPLTLLKRGRCGTRAGTPHHPISPDITRYHRRHRVREASHGPDSPFLDHACHLKLDITGDIPVISSRHGRRLPRVSRRFAGRSATGRPG